VQRSIGSNLLHIIQIVLLFSFNFGLYSYFFTYLHRGVNFRAQFTINKFLLHIQFVTTCRLIEHNYTVPIFAPLETQYTLA